MGCMPQNNLWSGDDTIPKVYPIPSHHRHSCGEKIFFVILQCKTFTFHLLYYSKNNISFEWKRPSTQGASEVGALPLPIWRFHTFPKLLFGDGSTTWKCELSWHKNAQWRKDNQMQPVWFYILSGKQFEETFENPWWRKDKQMQPVWFCILSCKCFGDTFDNALWRKVKQMQPSEILYLQIQAIWGDISWQDPDNGNILEVGHF